MHCTREDENVLPFHLTFFRVVLLLYGAAPLRSSTRCLFFAGLFHIYLTNCVPLPAFRLLACVSHSPVAGAVILEFEQRQQKLRDFATEVVGKPVFLVCNSVGGLAGLQAGVDAPEQVNRRRFARMLVTMVVPFARLG